MSCCNDEVEGLILFGDLNSVVFWHCNQALERYLHKKCQERGIIVNNIGDSLTQLFGSLINLETQYDTKQNNVDLIYCKNGFNVKLRHLGIYSLLVIGNNEEGSHLLYMADMFRAISQLFVGYSYGSLAVQTEISSCIAEVIRQNSLLLNSVPFQFLRGCEVVPASELTELSPAVKVCLEHLVSATTAVSILNGFGTVVEAHCFVSDMLMGSVRCAPQTTRQRLLPSELWKLRDMAKALSTLGESSCATLNVFLNACESPYFLACRVHVISPAPSVICVLLSEHEWASIARPIRRLLKLLSMILRGQPSVLRLTPRHLDTIASTELNKMSDCLDAFVDQGQSHLSKKSFDKQSASSQLESSGLTDSTSVSQILPSLSGARSLMQKALSQFRTLREKHALQSFCRDPRNTAHHSTVKQLYSIVEQLHTHMFQPLVSIKTPDIFKDPLNVAAQELKAALPAISSFGPSLPLVSADSSSKLVLSVLVDRSSNTFACFPTLRADPQSRISIREDVTISLKDLLNFMHTCMWRCWPFIRSGHSSVSWSMEFTNNSDEKTSPIALRFAYSSSVVTVPAVSRRSDAAQYTMSENITSFGDSSQFEQVFNDPDLTSQLIWNEHFYRMLARMYADFSFTDAPPSRALSMSNVFSVDFNANMRSRQVAAEQSYFDKKSKTLTIIYEAFCLFVEPITAGDVDSYFKRLFKDSVDIFADTERFFPLNGSAVNRR